jgi:vitamin B12/bleomycin/antimicrobial peptide transport system ATP-binding/permease protein
MQLIAKFKSFSDFVKRVVMLAMPYFRSEEKWKACGLLLAIVTLNLATVFVAVQFNDWNGAFYDALQKKDELVFWQQMGRFSYLAFGGIVIAVYKFYLTQMLEMRWRKWMTTHYLERWLNNQTFYKLELTRFTKTTNTDVNALNTDNPDQRISEDVNQFTTQTVSLSMGLLNALVTLVSFVGILWGLSGAFSFALGGNSYTLPGYMLWAAVAYCLIGSVLTHYIGRSQIKLNFFQQKYEADFRHHMIRVREYSESIALEKGETVEKVQLGSRFSAVIHNYMALIKAQKKLIWFTSFFGQAAIIFPFIVAAPRFFSGAIQLGQLMQIASAFGKVQESLSWFIDNYSGPPGYPSFATWMAVTNRLTTFDDSIKHSETLLPTQSVAIENSKNLSADDLTLSLPNGKVLLEHAALTAQAGDAILLNGPSGSGKSTLFRAFAGIWPFSQGQIHMPDNAMFIPQHPYFPNGTLRDALAYPEPATRYDDAALQTALTDALLPQLANRLDDKEAWSQMLSGGEQQRLAIARVLLKKPQWIFADEATSALDIEAENTLYKRLIASVLLAKGAIISIAHRPSVAAFHNTTWTLEKSAETESTYSLTLAPTQRS